MKNKIIFLVKCIMVMLPFILISLYARMNMMGYTDEEAPYYLWNREVCQNKTGHSYDVLILGDSAANTAYLPEVLSDSCVNLSLGGTTPMENYYTLKEYLKYNDAPKAVFISFMDFHFQTSDCYWIRTMYSHRYSACDNWEMLQEARRHDESSIWSESAYLDWISYELFLPDKYIASLSNGGFNQRLEGNTGTRYFYDIHDGRYIDRTVKEAPIIVDYHSFFVNPLFDDYYRKLLALCAENGIHVHLVKLPLPASDTFSEEYVQGFEQYFEAVKEAFPGVTVDWWDSYEDRLFTDSCHLNIHGALRFTRELKEKYSEDFNNTYSGHQLAGMDDYFSIENYLDELINWLDACPDYAAVVCDTVGDFPDRYERDYKRPNVALTDCAFSDRAAGIYVLEDTADRDVFDQIFPDGDELISIYPGDGTCYNWNPYGIHGVNVLVINTSSGEIVCEKKFLYINDEFVLQG